MGRLAVNSLTIEPVASGGWRLFGYFNGARIRQQSADVRKLARKKEALESQLVQAAALRPMLRQTWLSEAQLRDAEAAAQRAGSVRLLDCVIAAEKVLPAVHRVTCATALDQWLADLIRRARFPATIGKNRARIRQFLKFSGNPAFVTDLTADMVDRFVFRGTAGTTPQTDAAVLSAWLRWCLRKKLLAVLPFEIDMKDLAASARPVEDARILRSEQASALLTAAAAHRAPDGSRGKLVPYVILTLWCMMRHAEATRTTPALLRLNLSTPLVRVFPRKRRTEKYREVEIPANVVPFLKAALERGVFTVTKRNKATGAVKTEPGVFFSKTMWESVRRDAGLITLEERKRRGARRRIINSEWQENLLRHTGVSYLYQRTGDMKRVCREAGDTTGTAFRHYLTLPEPGDSTIFYSDNLVAEARRIYLQEAAAS